MLCTSLTVVTILTKHQGKSLGWVISTTRQKVLSVHLLYFLKLKICIKQIYFLHTLFHQLDFLLLFKELCGWYAVDIISTWFIHQAQHGKHSLRSNFKRQSCCAAALHHPAYSFIRTAYVLVLINSELDKHANILPVVFIIAAFSIFGIGATHFIVMRVLSNWKL